MEDDGYFFTVTGKYKDGMLEYEYPRWMFAWNYYPMLSEEIDAHVPEPRFESYEIINPNNVELIEGETYKARLIVFEDGDIAEIIEKSEPVQHPQLGWS